MDKTEHEGEILYIPERRDNNITTWDYLREAQCQDTKKEDCEKITCGTCMFGESNIEAFKIWYKKNYLHEL